MHFLRYLRGVDRHDHQSIVDEKPNRAIFNVVSLRSRFVVLVSYNLLKSKLLSLFAMIHQREYSIL